MLGAMRGLWRACRSRRGRWIINGFCAVLALLTGLLAARHFAESGWPLANADYGLVAASGLCFVLAYAFKAYGWQRLFAEGERPNSLSLAAAGGAASVTGAALPGRFDDVVRVAVVRRFRDCPSGVPTLCLSLFTLGLIDAAALMPFASTAAAMSDASMPVRAGLGVVAAAGIAAMAIVVTLPRLSLSSRLIRFRIARWLHEHHVSPPEAWKALVLVLASWMTRAVALLFLLQALGVSISMPMAIAFLVAAAASGALPVAPAGAATQAGAGAAILIASGLGASTAIAFAVAAQALLMLAGAAVVVFAAVWQGGRKLALMRSAA